VLSGVSFSIGAGRTTALVGSTGSGKSTVARLLFRYYDPREGAVFIDGQDVRSLMQTSLRGAIGIVPQDAVLFNESIRYNIAYGRPGASEADIIAAAKAAQIWPFICSLDAGLDSKVGERGLKLSGGEKQRVAIARTLLKDPPVLVLDEATSALDSITEAEVQEAISRAKQGRTVLVIAHRLSTVRDADEILVLEGGRVVERGAHDALIEAKGRYFALWSQQALLSSSAGGSGSGSGGSGSATNAAAEAPAATSVPR
jgi:ATP-binding cassette subfamily B protein